MTDTRFYTNYLLGLVEANVLDAEAVLLAALNHMTDEEVEDMAHRNNFFYEDDLDEDEMDEDF